MSIPNKEPILEALNTTALLDASMYPASDNDQTDEGKPANVPHGANEVPTTNVKPTPDGTGTHTICKDNTLATLHQVPSKQPNEPMFTNPPTIDAKDLAFLDAMCKDGDEDPCYGKMPKNGYLLMNTLARHSTLHWTTPNLYNCMRLTNSWMS